MNIMVMNLEKLLEMLFCLICFLVAVSDALSRRR
jgi:hypothetical protein